MLATGGAEFFTMVGQHALNKNQPSGRYYQPIGESELTLSLMRLIDETFLDCPYYGSQHV